jgi:glycosyltransferase involved in cell wall biosynthesis
MGLPIEFLQCLKDQNVKIVFSSHDYYGLCLKVNFINEKGILCKKPSGENCARCNQNSPNATFLRIRNAEIILHHKKMFSFLLHIKPRFSKPKAQIEHQKISQQKIIEFDKVINHYSQMFSLIDCFHFNSSVARDVYQAHLGDLQHKLIPITHAGILDNRQKRTIRSSNIQLGFIGNDTVYKGLPMLLSVLRTLAAEGKSNWTLHIWGNNKKGNTDEEKIIWHGKFKPSEYDKVFSEIDILIVPSLWNETFSLVTLEALSFAVPVMVSSNVGAKDIVINYEPTFVIEPTAEVLKAKLLYILSDYQSIINYHLKIRKGPFYYGLAQHAQDIEIELYHN